MTGKDLLKKALKCEATDRIPWVPFVGCHAGSLLGMTADEYLQSADAITNGIAKAVAMYKPDGIPVAFDLQIEAEILGCKLEWSKDNPPAVVSHPLAEGTTLDQLQIPGPEDGRLKTVLEAARQLRDAHPDVALYGLITGPFTLALHLMGTNVFMQMFDDPDHVHKVMAFCSETAKTVAGYYLEAGVDVVAVVDPMTSQIGPQQFESFVTPHLSPVFDDIRAKGGIGSLFVCGHAQKNIEVMCDTKPDNISIDENIALDYVRDICVPRNISFGGNLQLTTVLLLGTPQDAQRNAVACMSIGGEKGFILSPGCDLPFATPAANVEAIAKVAHDPYERQIAETLETAAMPESDIDMTGYGEGDVVKIDIVTLDSAGCAPCQYMVAAVDEIMPKFEGKAEWCEHKVKTGEGIAMMIALGVQNIPTICIDGKIAFVSVIPSRDDLIAAVQARLEEKQVCA